MEIVVRGSQKKDKGKHENTEGSKGGMREKREEKEGKEVAVKMPSQEVKETGEKCEWPMSLS